MNLSDLTPVQLDALNSLCIGSPDLALEFMITTWEVPPADAVSHLLEQCQKVLKIDETPYDFFMVNVPALQLKDREYKLGFIHIPSREPNHDEIFIPFEFQFYDISPDSNFVKEILNDLKLSNHI